ncbi:hypothetical protein GCM10009603_29950 [Nocardiopsis exhalans]
MFAGDAVAVPLDDLAENHVLILAGAEMDKLDLRDRIGHDFGGVRPVLAVVARVLLAARAGAGSREGRLTRI